MSMQTNTEDPHTMSSQRDRREPSTRELAVVVLVVVGFVAYAAIGISYAAAHVLDRAGITGFNGLVAWGSQVLGWPLMMVMK
ncbi:hypothetical protein [Nocardioides montaniterrae]